MAQNERMFCHENAQRLDDPERQKSLPVDVVLRHLELRPGVRIADVGAGTGYFAIPMARAVMSKGRVFAVDVQPEMLALLRSRVEGSTPIQFVEGNATNTTLPAASVDLVFLANVWHEIDDRAAALQEAGRILRPTGRIAIVDWRSDVHQPPGPPMDHRIAATEVTAMVEAAGWKVTISERVGFFSYMIVATRQ